MIFSHLAPAQETMLLITYEKQGVKTGKITIKIKKFQFNPLTIPILSQNFSAIVPISKSEAETTDYWVMQTKNSL